MKPKPYRSVHEMLTHGDKPQTSILPYDTYPNDKAGFTTFSIHGKFIAFPLPALCKASLGDNASSISLQFGSTVVCVDSKELDELFEDILLGRVRVVRMGVHPRCSVEKIRFSEIALS